MIFMLAFVSVIALASTTQDTQVFTLVAYDESGQELRKSYGFTFGGSDYIATTYDAVVGSAKIVAISANNKRIEIARIAGVNALYNIAKLQLSVTPTAARIQLETLKVPAKAKVFVNAKWQTTSVASNTPFNGYNFYTLSTQHMAWAGLPLYSDKGNVVGMIQQGANKNAALTAIDIKAIDDLKNGAIALGEANYKGISIPRSLPPAADEANAYLYLLLNSSKDSVAIDLAVKDFITLFPADPNGYLYKAELQMRNQDKTGALSSYNEALARAQQPDAVHYSWAKILLKGGVHRTDTAYRNTQIKEVLETVNKAYATKNDPLYALTQADCLFELAAYAEAKDKYLEVARSAMGEAQHFLYAVQAQQHVAQDYVIMEGLITEGLDKFTKPYSSAAVPFLMQRALCYQKQNKHRQAVTDLLECERIAVAMNDNKRFKESLYVLRYQSALEAKLYQQALTDAEALVAINPSSCSYRMHRAVIWAVAGERAKALADCEWVSSQCPDNVESYVWQTIIYAEAKQKAKVKAALEKIKTLQPSLYEEMAKKYK